MDAIDILIKHGPVIVDLLTQDLNRRQAYEAFQKQTGGADITYNTFRTFYKPVARTLAKGADQLDMLKQEKSELVIAQRLMLQREGALSNQADYWHQQHDKLQAQMWQAQAAIDERAKLERRIEQLEAKLKIEKAPPSFQGWTVRRDNKGYYRLNRMNGRQSQSAYVGKVWTKAKAQSAIQKYEAAH